MALGNDFKLRKDLFTLVVVVVFAITIIIAGYFGVIAPNSNNVGATYELGSAVANLGTTLITLFLFVILFQTTTNKKINKREFLVWIGIAILLALVLVAGYVFSPKYREAITQSINYISDILLFIFASVFVYKEYLETISKDESSK